MPLLPYHITLYLLQSKVPCLPFNFITGALTRDSGLRTSKCVAVLWNTDSCYSSLWQNGDQMPCFKNKSDAHSLRPLREIFLNFFLVSFLWKHLREAMYNNIWLFPTSFCIHIYLWRSESLQRISRKGRPWKIFCWSCSPCFLEQWDLFSLPGNLCSTCFPLLQTHGKFFAQLRELMSFTKIKFFQERTMGKVDVSRHSTLTRAMYLWQVRIIRIGCITPWELPVVWLVTGRHLKQHKVSQETESAVWQGLDSFYQLRSKNQVHSLSQLSRLSKNNTKHTSFE